jgi:hypothetical protein
MTSEKYLIQIPAECDNSFEMNFKLPFAPTRYITLQIFKLPPDLNFQHSGIVLYYYNTIPL